MYRSILLINVGDNPDRPRPGRLWLRNLYRVHQRLCMAFPSTTRKSNDPDFLTPYQPGDFPEQRHLADRGSAAVDHAVLKAIHTPRSQEHGFLFRVDPHSGGRTVILVQSTIPPDWDYAFHNASFLLAAKPECREIEPTFMKGQKLRFRLLANPTRKIDTKSGPDGKRRHGKRVPVPADHLYEWLVRRAELGGFTIAKDSIAIQPGYVYVNKPWNGKPCPKCGEKEMKEKEGPEGTMMVCQSKSCGQEVKPFRDRLRSCRYDGMLEVTDPVRFRETLVQGIGPAKAFGFGLLSLKSGDA